MARVEVICGWCRKGFETENQRNDKTESYPKRVCPHCGRKVSSSRIELTNNAIGKKHFHSPSRKGDIV